MKEQQRGPTTPRTRSYLNQPSYRWMVDRLTCCGCVVHSGPETGPCDCRCHLTARLVASGP